MRQCANFLFHNPRSQLHLAYLALLDSHEIGCLMHVKLSSLFPPSHSTDFNQVSFKGL